MQIHQVHKKNVLSLCSNVLLTCTVANVPAIFSFSLNAISLSFSASSFSANALLCSLNVFTSIGTSDLVFAFIPYLSRDSTSSKDDCSDQKGVQYCIHTAYQSQTLPRLFVGNQVTSVCSPGRGTADVGVSLREMH